MERTINQLIIGKIIVETLVDISEIKHINKHVINKANITIYY